MRKDKNIISVLTGAAFLLLTACSNRAVNNSSVASQRPNPAATDSLIIRQNELREIYTQAIAQLIKTEYVRRKTSYDTLYFGKHIYGQPDDFPT